MHIREIVIANFRGIRAFVWQPAAPFTCIVGAGDSGKSTILDAIELALGTRWANFADVDFTDGDTSLTIEITVTVGGLPASALRENRMGMHLRGWRHGRALRDEPEGDDEPVVTVRLTVDASLEPEWELVTDRHEARTLSQRDRALFGVVRLGGDVERHLTWAQGSALARLSADKDQAATILADAYRVARNRLGAGSLPTLDAAAAQVREQAVALGAYAGATYHAGLDTQRSSMSLGTLAMHDDGVPLRQAGLGTRRLVALAAQRSSIPDGAIVLIDEVEHGLEPHRLRHALQVLRAATVASGQGGQVILTTHSSISVVELACSQLAVCRRTNQQVDLRTPSPELQAIIRRQPEAFLARCLVVCEGKTEIGIIRGLKRWWAQRHNDEPFDARGVVLADGNGSQVVATACSLASLGYSVAVLRDSDTTLSSDESGKLTKAGIRYIEWAEGVCTEQRVFLDVSATCVQALLDLALQDREEQSLLDSLRPLLKEKTPIGREFATWDADAKSDRELRGALGAVAHKQSWFKNVDGGERVGELLATELAQSHSGSSHLARALNEVEQWMYGN